MPSEWQLSTYYAYRKIPSSQSACCLGASISRISARLRACFVKSRANPPTPHVADAAIEVTQSEFGLKLGLEISIMSLTESKPSSHTGYPRATQRANLTVRATIDTIEQSRTAMSDKITISSWANRSALAD